MGDDGQGEDERAGSEVRADELQDDVESKLARLGGLVDELDRRRRRVRRPAAVLAAVVAGAALGGWVVWRLQARRRARATRWRRAIGRAAAHPDRVAARPPGVAKKVALAAATTLASFATRRLAQRWLARPARG